MAGHNILGRIAMRSVLFTLFSAATLLIACGPGGTDANGTGGSGSASTSSTSTGGTGGSGNTATGGNAGSGSGGSTGNACTPSFEDYNCTADLTYTDCSCDVMDTTDESPGMWCQGARSLGVEICPGPPANTCRVGHNNCSYDLPPGVDYEPADPTCLGYVQNSTWTDENGNPGQSGIEFLPNGIVRTGIGALMGPSNGYYLGFLMSGKKLYYNMANAGNADVGEGELSPDCMTITVTFTFVPTGVGQPETFHWSHFNQ